MATSSNQTARESGHMEQHMPYDPEAEDLRRELEQDRRWEARDVDVPRRAAPYRCRGWGSPDGPCGCCIRCLGYDPDSEEEDAEDEEIDDE